MLISIIIPSRNCLTYLKYAIQTVITQNYKYYELLVSDNYSDDGTWEYLQTIQHPRVRIMQPPKICSMAGHYEWLLTQTKGDWITIVGSDDGVQPYFFHLADNLIKLANTYNIKVINAERAYYFWQDGLWENLQTSYIAYPTFTIRNSGKEFLSTMLTTQGYFSLPQIYAGSLVHRDIIQQIKEKQNGKFYNDAIPDAYGAAALASIKVNYIHSNIPLIWVGTSAQSNGGGVSKKHKQDFYLQIKKEGISFHPLLRHIKYGRTISAITLWMWEAMLNAQQLQDQQTRRFYQSRFCQYLATATMLREMRSYTPTQPHKQQKQMFYSLVHQNKLSPCLVVSISYILGLYRKRFFQRALRKIIRILGLCKYYKAQTFYNTYSEFQDMLEASKCIDNLTKPMWQHLDFTLSNIKSQS